MGSGGALDVAAWRGVVDHHRASEEAARAYVPGSARVVRLDAYIPDYATTTSDHYPILTALRPEQAVDSVSK